MALSEIPRPDWYTPEQESAWSKVKAAFRRDWQQTEHDFGANVPNLNQQIGDTIAQAAGSKQIPPGDVPTSHPPTTTTPSTTSYRDEDEPAYQYGYSAYRHTAETAQQDPGIWEDAQDTFYREWQDKNEWERYREAIRRGWNYGRLERYRNLPR